MLWIATSPNVIFWKNDLAFVTSENWGCFDQSWRSARRS